MKKFFLCLPLMLLFTSCASTGWFTRDGGAWVVVRKDSGIATSKRKITKQGRACSLNILGIVSVGDSSITKAKEEGKITRVSHVDHDLMNILGIYGSVCTIVYGS